MVRIARASTIGTIALLVVATAAGQQFGTAEDLASFALALNDAKLSDLGKEVVKKAIESGVQDPQGQLASALCEISATEAIRTADVTQRLAKLKEAVAAYETYLKKFSSGEKAAIARLKLSEWLRTAGETVAAQIKKEGDAAKKEALKSDGLNFFTKAEVLAKARIEELARIPKDKITEIQQEELYALEVRGRAHAVLEGAAVREPRGRRGPVAPERGAEPPRRARPRPAGRIDPRASRRAASSR